MSSSLNNQTRREMLATIRGHLEASMRFNALHAEHHKQHDFVGKKDAVEDVKSVSLLERFKQSLAPLGGHCFVVKDEKEASETVQQIIEKHNAERVAVTDSLVVNRIVNEVKTNAVILKNASKENLFDCNVGITSAQWAISETGTLVLESDKERNRLTSLVPPVHIAILEADKIRQTLSEILYLIGKNEMSRTVTFITGPSRTSDIELTLAIGVHGPAELYVVVIEGETHG